MSKSKNKSKIPGEDPVIARAFADYIRKVEALFARVERWHKQRRRRLRIEH